MNIRSLVSIRWYALAGQLLVFALLLLAYDHQVALGPFLLCSLVSLLLNVGLLMLSRSGGSSSRKILGGALTADVLLLAILIFFYGGYANPFSMMFLVYVVLAACFLGTYWTWFLFGLTSVSYLALFRWYVPFQPLAGMSHHGHGGFDLHLHGMVVVYLFMGAIVSYFVTTLTRTLEELRAHQFVHEKLAALTSMIAGAAHEMATPLGTAYLALEELQSKLGSSPDMSSVRRDVTDLATQLGRVRDVLDRLRARSPELLGETRRRIRLDALVSRALARLRPQDQERISVDLESPAVELQTLVSSLEESLVVLLQNSVESDGQDDRIQITGRVINAECQISVRDFGGGVPAELISKLGEPFFSTKPSGMGLGLHLVRSLMAQIGGNVTFVARQPGLEVLLAFPSESK